MASPGDEFPDGLDALLAELNLPAIMSLIERTAVWVDPETFRLLPVWYPEYARKVLFYKENWTLPQMNTTRGTSESVHKREGNLYANKALTKSLGLRSNGRANWSCCHIWGVDDFSFQASNTVVQDRRFFSCVANMVLLPTPLKAFTDTMPEVKAMIRICARNFYTWNCDHEDLCDINTELSEWSDWTAWPSSWPRKPGGATPIGVRPLTPAIRSAAQKRLEQIRSDLIHAGPFYPRDEVRKVLAYWNIPEHIGT